MVNYLGVLSSNIIDSYGIPGQSSIFVNIADTVSLATIATIVAEYVTDLGPMTQGVQRKATLRLIFPGDGQDVSVAAGDIEKSALFNLANASTPYLQGILVPDVAPTILNANGLVDLTNVDVAAFIAFLTAAHSGITPVNKAVEAMTALSDALITFRKHRKPLSRKTKEI